MKATILLCSLLACGPAGLAQFAPEDAQVNLYFPQLADGGTPVQKWQTGFIFVNPNPQTTAAVTLWLYANDGSPLSLDLGLAARGESPCGAAPNLRNKVLFISGSLPYN